MNGSFLPSHVAPPEGLATWPQPDPAMPPGPRITGGLDVQLIERQGDWGRVVCSNAWTAWVDGRLLVPRAVASGP